MTKRVLSLLLLSVGVALVGCASETEEPTPSSAVDNVSTSEDALTIYKKFTQRFMCTTTPTDPNVYCQSKGYDGGSIYSTSSCFRVDTFSVKDVVYNCRVRT